MKKILNTILFWRKWTRKLSKPLITDKDFEDIEAEIAKDLHINEPATYQLKRNKMKKRKPC